MELNINSPSYFTKQYGFIDEIYSMCRGISKHVENKQYSDLVDIVGITPIIAPKDIIEQGLFKQEKKCDIKYGFASVSLWIDYDEYLKADITDKQIMIVKNILASIKTISRKAKIDYKQFCEDIFQYCKLINLPIESNLKV